PTTASVYTSSVRLGALARFPPPGENIHGYGSCELNRQCVGRSVASAATRGCTTAADACPTARHGRPPTESFLRLTPTTAHHELDSHSPQLAARLGARPRSVVGNGSCAGNAGVVSPVRLRL